MRPSSSSCWQLMLNFSLGSALASLQMLIFQYLFAFRLVSKDSEVRPAPAAPGGEVIPDMVARLSMWWSNRRPSRYLKRNGAETVAVSSAHTTDA